MPLVPNIACLDYTVAKSRDRLVGYYWGGEETLGFGKCVWVDRVES